MLKNDSRSKDYFSKGIMQGRLSTKDKMPLQSFPVNNWQEEFKLASELKIDQIEWLVDDVKKNSNNPILTTTGRSQILDTSYKNNIDVKTLCAHYFINYDINFIQNNRKEIEYDFLNLLEFSDLVGIKMISIPFMDQISLKNYDLRQEISDFFNKVLIGNGPIVLIESDLEGILIKDFIESLSLDRLGVLYDTGNANAYNLNPIKDFSVLSDHIYELHIKDRASISGDTMRLGMGDTPFELYKDILDQHKWKGPLVLETPTFKNFYEEAFHNINFLNTWLEKV
jgi:sugar phosphate isomerase/epimerase